MKFYPKQLNSLEDLKREKHALKLAIKHSEPLISFNDFRSGNTSSAAVSGEEFIDKVIAAFDSKSILNSIIGLAPMLFSFVSTKTGFSKKAFNFLENVGKEVLSGYVSWKAIKYSYKALKFLFKPKKKNKEQA